MINKYSPNSQEYIILLFTQYQCYKINKYVTVAYTEGGKL